MTHTHTKTPPSPYIPSNRHVKEFSFRAVMIGVCFGLLFAVANAYLALKIGQTVSASIPAAIFSMGLMRVFFKGSTILEQNLIQTIATVGEGLAAGAVFTIPALFLLEHPPSIGMIFLLCALGGILGILFMIPMRRFVIVEEHHQVPFPEGTACAEILKAGDQHKKDTKAKQTSDMFSALWGIIAGALFKVCTGLFFLWQETLAWSVSFFRNAQFNLDASPALLGVGYIIGPRIAAVMFMGSVLAWWVIIPLIGFFGTGSSAIFPADTAVYQLSPQDIWADYIRYIGAGTVAVGGLLGLVRVFPIFHKTIRSGLKDLRKGWATHHLARTDRDISLAWLVLGSLAIILTLWLVPIFSMNLLTIILLTLLSFFFTAVTSLTVGLVGSTSNPVSGMTLTTILVACLIFVLLGWTSSVYLFAIITMGAVACIAICMAGTTAQDLKAGFLLGATPRSQQIAEMIGVLLPSLALGYVLHLFNGAYQFGSPQMPAPQAAMIAIIAQSSLGGYMPYALVMIGAVIGIIVAVLRIPILPFALGIYLPFSLTAATALGGLIRAWINRREPSAAGQMHGILFASGLIGGDALMGILVAALTVAGSIAVTNVGLLSNWIGLVVFLGLGGLLARAVCQKR